MPASISHALSIATTGMQLCETNLSVKAQNISGQGLDTFKRRYLVATDLPSHDFAAVGMRTSTGGTISPTGLQIGMGVQSAGIYSVFSQGDPIQTNNSLDVMIDGEGFFKITLPDGSMAYTRVGAWQLSPNQEIVMPKTGYQLSPSIKLPQDTLSVHINQFGEVFVETKPGLEQKVADITLTTFPNQNGLKAIGDSMYIQTDASGFPQDGIAADGLRGSIKQGWREGSNVNAVEEVTDLIKIEKNYDLLSKVIKTGDKMAEISNTISPV